MNIHYLHERAASGRANWSTGRLRAALGRAARAVPSALFRYCLRWREDRRADRDMTALLAMSDHLLSDIGISRHDVCLRHARDRAEWRR